jgi:hypothetical protein
MEQGEVLLIMQAHLPEGFRDGATITSQERAYHQYERLVLGRASESWLKVLQDPYNRGG